MVDAIEVDQEPEKVRPAVGERIEQADLDLGVRVERGDARVAILEIDSRRSGSAPERPGRPRAGGGRPG
jgi:hypothetical protein